MWCKRLWVDSEEGRNRWIYYKELNVLFFFDEKILVRFFLEYYLRGKDWNDIKIILILKVVIKIWRNKRNRNKINKFCFYNNNNNKYDWILIILK